MAAANVGEMGKGLADALEVVGRMDVNDAKQWIVDNYSEEEGEEPKNINFVMGYGKNPHRKWWTQEGTELVWIPEEDRFPSKVYWA